MTAECREHLERAKELVQTNSDEAKRIELFSKTFRYSEYLLQVANAETVDPAVIDGVRKYVREVIVPDPMTIHTRGERTEAAEQLEQVLRQITKDKPVK